MYVSYVCVHRTCHRYLYLYLLLLLYYHYPYRYPYIHFCNYRFFASVCRRLIAHLGTNTGQSGQHGQPPSRSRQVSGEPCESDYSNPDMNRLYHTGETVPDPGESGRSGPDSQYGYECGYDSSIRMYFDHSLIEAEIVKNMVSYVCSI